MQRAISDRRLNRVLAFALRHHPDAFGLTLDRDGFVSIRALLAAIRLKYFEWPTLDESHLIAVTDRTRHQRFEIVGDKMRALYGHSVSVSRRPETPPSRLFHATAPELLQLILSEGLKPMQRAHVQLSTDMTYARSACKSSSIPVLLSINAPAASAAGVRFYRATPSVWLADAISPAFMECFEDVSPRQSQTEQRTIVKELFRSIAEEA